jgi:cysteine-rich repeat protein
MKRLRPLVALVALAAGVLTFGCSSEGAPHLGEARSALTQQLGAEIEQNDTAGQATPIPEDGVVRASIQPSAEVDFFSFPGAPGKRVYVAAVTAFSSSGPDSLLDILAPDGTTVIETDNDNGSLPGASSSIAGAVLTQAGTHFVRMRSGSNGNIRPYDLHIKTQTGAPVPEIEPNDLPAFAQSLPASGWVAGDITAASDLDLYKIALSAGDTVYASLDLDPDRGGSDLAGVLSAGPFGGSFLQVDDPGGTGPDSEALVFTVKEAGDHLVGVSAAGGTGDYHLSVSVHEAARGNCAEYASPDPAVPIPAGPGQVTSTIDVPGNPRVADIDVSLSLTHSSPKDMDLVLEAPNGNQIVLFTDVGSGALPDLHLTIDDEAAFPASAFDVLNGLAVQPEPGARLDWLDGQDAGGTWTLRAFDDAPSNGGTLHGWSLTVCEPPPEPTCAGGSPPVTPLSTDFEANDGGFTHTGVADSWARGTPAQAPNFTTCHSGTVCFKTNLIGDYPTSSSQDLVSPPIDLTSTKAPIRASWAMRYQLESATFDHAWVEVRAAGGGPVQRLFEWTGSTMTATVGKPSTTVQQVAGWGLYTADLSAFAGNSIQLVFHLDSDQAKTFPGLAVDDVKVTACPAQACGNGVLEGDEACDDGNQLDGDGCSAGCVKESQGGVGGAGGSGSTAGSGGSGAGGSGSGAGGSGSGAGGSGSGAGGSGASTGAGGSGAGAAAAEAFSIGGGGLTCSAPGPQPERTSAPWAAALGALGLGLIRLRRRRAAR